MSIQSLIIMLFGTHARQPAPPTLQNANLFVILKFLVLYIFSHHPTPLTLRFNTVRLNLILLYFVLKKRCGYEKNLLDLNLQN